MRRVKSPDKITKDNRKSRKKWADTLKVVGLQVHEVYDLMDNGTAKLWKSGKTDAFVGSDKYFVRVPKDTFSALKRYGIITLSNRRPISPHEYYCEYSLTPKNEQIKHIIKNSRENAKKIKNPNSRAAKSYGSGVLFV